MPILPVPSPPFHQTWLPPLRPEASARKLQTVRFSTETPSTLKISMPLRPLPFGPGSCSTAAALQAPAPGSVPSTITALRSIPRRWDPGGPDQHPGQLDLALVALLVVVTRSDQYPIAGFRGANRRLDRVVLTRDPMEASNLEHARGCVRCMDPGASAYQDGEYGIQRPYKGPSDVVHALPSNLSAHLTHPDSTQVS